MDDLTAKIERAKALLSPALAPDGDTRLPHAKAADAAELSMIGLDLAGALILDVHRIADALGAIAARPPETKMDVKAEPQPFRPLSGPR